jgi:hypothetical protein
VRDRSSECQVDVWAEHALDEVAVAAEDAGQGVRELV